MRLEELEPAVVRTLMERGVNLTGIPQRPTVNTRRPSPQPVNPGLSGIPAAPSTVVSPPTTAKPDSKPAAPQLTAVDGLALFNAEHSEPEPVVDGLLYRGVTVFAGRPKVGKSWFALQLACAVALGSKFLDSMAVNRPGRVVYLALEEPQARTSNRLRKLVNSPQPGLSNLHFVYRVKPLLNGGAAEVDAYLTANPAELVVVDTLLAIVRAGSGRDVLRSDYNEMNILRQTAEKHRTAIVVVHHLRKAGAENGLDAVAGTTGLTAACDAIWTLKRLPGGDFLLEVTGREMEDKVYRLKFDGEAPFGWKITGQGSEVGLSEERQEILELLKDEAPLKPARIAAMLRKNAVAVRRLLQKLYADGFIQKNRDGGYCLSSYVPGNSGNGGKE